MNQQALEALPQGTNTPLDKALLQVPGVSQDSAASGELHVRNEHANLQYRINGIMLPDGVGAFGQIIDTGIVGSLALITGALPAQYGLRTAGVLDIQTKADAFNNSGSVSVYGGSHGTITTSLEYGGTVGQTQYFVSGRYFGSNLGIENPTPAYNAIHDNTSQEKGFLYLSTVLDPSSRLTFMSGVSNGTLSDPQQSRTAAGLTAFGVSNFNSALLNERQSEFNQFNVLAYQKSGDGIRLPAVLLQPLQPVALPARSDRRSGLQRRGVRRLPAERRQRHSGGYLLSCRFRPYAEIRLFRQRRTFAGEQRIHGAAARLPWAIRSTRHSRCSIPAPRPACCSAPIWQDEWKVTNNLTVNAGLRFDQMWQYVDANQLSPRLSMTWKPIDGTTFHAGYSRNFTPPEQVLAAPTNLALVQNTTAQAPPGSANDPVLPERSNVFDVGVVQKIYAIPGLEVGLDAYYKTATDLLDDGQFGAGLCADRLQLRAGHQ